jgi:hypothetical protein
MKVNDEACIIFAKAFYQTLFSGNNCTIVKAFEFAKEAVRIQDSRTFPKGEHQKFLFMHRATIDG